MRLVVLSSTYARQLAPLRGDRRFMKVRLLAIALVLLTTGCRGGKFAAHSSSAQMTHVNSATVALADHLSQTGAKLYGAYWCPYCNRQKALFGDAVSHLLAVECDPNGENAQPAACANANVNSYPTWEIRGKFYLGLRSLEELAALSGYQGSMNFGS